MLPFFDLPANTTGVLVGDVQAKGPGAKAGIQEGDVIVSYRGQKIKAMGQLQVLVQLTRPGTRVAIGIIRNGQPMTLHATVGRFRQPARKTARTTESKSAGVHLGIQFETLTQQIRDQLNIPANIHGAIIEAVQPGSPAYNASLSRGMVIEEVNRHAVSSASQLRQMLAAAPANRAVLLRLYLNGGSAFIVVHPAEP
jgi:serine protease Do